MKNWHHGHSSKLEAEQLGSRDFGKPNQQQTVPDQAARDRLVVSHVLSDFPADISEEVDTLIRRAADAAVARSAC